MERIEPIGPDRTVPPVELRRLTPLEREEERERRERRRKRRQAAQQSPEERPEDGRPGIDVRV
jgi:hypothetical protein